MTSFRGSTSSNGQNCTDRDFASFELEESKDVPAQLRYEGPCQHAVYSPMPFLETEKLIGNSEEMHEVFDLIGTAAETDLNLLIQGESGAGKTLIARAVHEQSDRSDSWFVVVNCDLLGAEDLDPVLFGPSEHTSEGVLEAASGGTIVLDHVDRLSATAQRHLTHLLETHSLELSEGIKSDTFTGRFITTATAVSQGEVDPDLYYRLSQFPIRVPPLRDRSGDSVRLAHYFLREYSTEGRRGKAMSLSKRAKKKLRAHHWPGNVRELKNVIKRATKLADGSTVQEAHLHFAPLDSQPGNVSTADTREEEMHERPEFETHSTSAGQFARSSDADAPSDTFFVDANGGIPEIEDMKRQAVKHAYELCDGNVDEAAVELGIGRSTMYRLLRRYDLM